MGCAVGVCAKFIGVQNHQAPSQVVPLPAAATTPCEEAQFSPSPACQRAAEAAGNPPCEEA